MQVVLDIRFQQTNDLTVNIINGSSEEREIGGLGIHIVKKLMDEVNYEYKNKKNHL